MASKYLDGSMVPRSVTRSADHRTEPRADAHSQPATLRLRGRTHPVELVNLSRSGAMLILPLIPHIGETISLDIAGRGRANGHVCWVRNGRIGVTFSDPLE